MSCETCGAVMGHSPACEPLKAVKLIDEAQTLFEIRQIITAGLLHNIKINLMAEKILQLVLEKQYGK